MPFHATLVPPLGVPWTDDSRTIHWFSLNLLVGASARLQGVELGGLVNIDAEQAAGVQLAGLAKIVGGPAPVRCPAPPPVWTAPSPGASARRWAGHLRVGRGGSGLRWLYRRWMSLASILRARHVGGPLFQRQAIEDELLDPPSRRWIEIREHHDRVAVVADRELPVHPGRAAAVTKTAPAVL